MKLQTITSIPLIALISAFLMLDLTLLSLNLTLTHKLEKDAFIINVSGRQRMLSQIIAKNLLISSAEPDNSFTRDELISSAQLFSQTLRSLQFSGDIVSADGQTLFVDSLKDGPSQKMLKETSHLWDKVSKAILNGDHLSKETANTINQYVFVDNKIILNMMNRLTVRAEYISNNNARNLRLAQVAIFVLVLINFGLIIRRFYLANKNSQAFMIQFDELVHYLPQAILLIDQHNKITYTNAVTSEVFPHTQDTFIGKSINAFIPHSLKNGSIELFGRHWELTVSTIRSIPSEITMVSLLDITESELFKLKSLIDPLTQLLNRNGLIETYSQSESSVSEIVCLFLDLDKFKEVNDKYGHVVGDEVLMIIAKRLKACVKTNDIVARFGGDEFIIIFHTHLKSPDIENLCQRIKTAVLKEINIDQLILHIGISIGVRRGYPLYESLEEIIDDADKAMYIDKQQHSFL